MAQVNLPLPCHGLSCRSLRQCTSVVFHGSSGSWHPPTLISLRFLTVLPCLGLRRSPIFAPPYSSTTSSSLSSSLPSSSSSPPLACAALCEISRALHGKPTQGHKVRTQHSRRWWLQSKARHLSAIPHEEARSRPHFPGYNEDVDRPLVVPQDACCFNCDKPIESDNINSYVWVPAGNAKVPTSQGYFFHFHCFQCWNCHLRLIHNQFFSKDGRAWCISCALGREVKIPSRRWHTSFVNTHRTGSRLTGEFFPRYRHQMEFLFNPKE